MLLILDKKPETQYKNIAVGRNQTYFAKCKAKSKNKYIMEDIIYMLDFLIDNIFVPFRERVFQQTISIQMGTNCAPLSVDSFRPLWSYSDKKDNSFP